MVSMSPEMSGAVYSNGDFWIPWKFIASLVPSCAFFPVISKELPFSFTLLKINDVRRFPNRTDVQGLWSILLIEKTLVSNLYSLYAIFSYFSFRLICFYNLNNALKLVLFEPGI